MPTPSLDQNLLAGDLFPDHRSRTAGQHSNE
jgi:hypothetical protein